MIPCLSETIIVLLLFISNMFVSAHQKSNTDKKN